jgi:heme/copper-type cytochrome/quinol oxidase subunit 2
VIDRAAVVTATTALLIGGLVGCGGSSNTASPSLTPSSAPAGASGSSTTKQPAPAGLVVNVTITNGQVTPTNATLQAKVGQPITFNVTSDATDELHVHSTPDHEFEVAAAPNQRFQFSIDVPGSVEVELHHLDRTVATIQVTP